ncbi:transposase [Methanolobus sp. ZRKC5]|uniref:transposase n=1 Tax=Methanolobus sp. ZRKC5 TaxID=3136295 RepID=UPI00313F2DD2
MHVCVSSESFPLTVLIASGKAHDRQQFVKIMESIKVKTAGRPKTRPLEVLADSAYDDVAIRKYLRHRAIKSNILVNIRNQKYPKRGRPTRFEYESYRKRGTIERFFAWLKMGFRKIASRYERLMLFSRDYWILHVFYYVGIKFKRRFEIGSLFVVEPVN